MATKEHVHQLIDSLPDTPETELRLEAVEHELESNGGSDGTNSAVPNAARRARNFLISVADGTSGLDLDSLRTVRDRAWR